MTYIMCKRCPRLLKHSTFVVIGILSFPRRHTLEVVIHALLKIRLKYGLHPVVPREQMMTESKMEAHPMRAYEGE